ncbi:MAG: hypothetical protein V1701_08995 [Planctomycetota bacterium]
MNQSPIPKAFSILLGHKVRALLIGGQACILYGAAEFSRDIDIAVLVSTENLEYLKSALRELKAEGIFVPDLSEEVLLKGHACHFRCQREDVKDLRVDIISVMRGVDSFPDLWERREEIELPEIGKITVIGLSDLVKAKKTQRDKDWPMIRRLIEADIYRASSKPSTEKVFFWLSECRTPELLISLSAKYSKIASGIAARRSLLKSAIEGNHEKVQGLLVEEEEKERELDRQYWSPLKAELESWRHQKNKQP